MRYNMLYKGSKEEQTITFLSILEAFTDSFIHGDVTQVETIKVDSAIVDTLIYAINESEFPHIDGLDASSAFKKASHLITYIIEMQPITGVIFKDEIDNHYSFTHVLNDFNPNAVFALHLGISLINNHEMDKGNGEKVQPSDVIAVTEHSYYDILGALSESSISPSMHYSLIALLLEQMFYKTNPKLQYDDFFCGSKEYKESCKTIPEHYHELIAQTD